MLTVCSCNCPFNDLVTSIDDDDPFNDLMLLLILMTMVLIDGIIELQALQGFVPRACESNKEYKERVQRHMG